MVAVHPIPRWLASMLGADDPLSKSASHKYIRKIPAGVDPKTGTQRWRYYYTVTGGHMLGHHEELKEGASFAVKRAGKAGHVHIDKVEGEHLHIRHDETGQTAKVHRDVLQDMLHREHATKIAAEHTKADAAVERLKGQEGTRGFKSREKRSLAHQDKIRSHFSGLHHAAERIDQSSIKGTDDARASELVTFGTKAAATKMAAEVGLSSEHVRATHPRAQRALGGKETARWTKYTITDPQTHQALTQRAARALSDAGAKERTKTIRRFLEKPKPKTVPVEKDPDALPRSYEQIAEQLAGKIDLGAVEPDKLQDHLRQLDLPEASLKKIKTVKEGLVAAIRAAKPKTWRDLAEAPVVGQQKLLDFLREFEGLEHLELPQKVRDRHEGEDYYRHLAEREAAYEGEGDGKSEPPVEDTHFDPYDLERSLLSLSARSWLRKAVSYMPANAVKGPGDEHLWSAAKKAAADQGRAKDWKYVMGIFERMKSGAGGKLARGYVSHRGPAGAGIKGPKKDPEHRPDGAPVAPPLEEHHDVAAVARKKLAPNMTVQKSTGAQRWLDLQKSAKGGDDTQNPVRRYPLSARPKPTNDRPHPQKEHGHSIEAEVKWRQKPGHLTEEAEIPPSIQREGKRDPDTTKLEKDYDAGGESGGGMAMGLKKSRGALRYLEAVDPLRKCMGSSMGPADPEWTERFEGTGLYTEVLELELEYRKKAQELEDASRKANEANEAKRKALRLKMRAIQKEEGDSYDGEDHWEKRRRLDSEFSKKRTALDTRLLEMKKDEAKRAEGALRKSMLSSNIDPMGDFDRVLAPYVAGGW